jgi:DNA-binding Lrp family transcriptional regulator
MRKVQDITTDPVDRELIDLLRANARTPVSDLARALGLSRTTVQSRLERLERSKRIAGYTVKLSDAHERGHIQAYVMIVVHPKTAHRVAEQMQAMAGVRRLQSVSGPANMVALLEVPAAADVDALVERIGGLEGVERATPTIILGTRFDR